MKVCKSSRHSKITGDFAESLVLYWLSKYGFESANVDHTGIDIIARNPKTKEIMGISVKSRCRNTGEEGTYIRIPKDNFSKIKKACKAFGCLPYFAIVVDEADSITVFILKMEKLLKMFPIGKSTLGWKMNKKNIERYRSDPDIKIIEFSHETKKWW